MLRQTSVTGYHNALHLQNVVKKMSKAICHIKTNYAQKVNHVQVGQPLFNLGLNKANAGRLMGQSKQATPTKLVELE
jgi:hypothetical protein